MDQMQADGIAPWTLPCSELNCKKRDKKKKKKLLGENVAKRNEETSPPTLFPKYNETKIKLLPVIKCARNKV